MKVIFLDVDGVLNHTGTKERFNGFVGIDPSNVAHFNELMDRTDAKIVISSSWRCGRPHEEIVKILRDHNVKGDIIGQTPESFTGVRGDEIMQWLTLHGPIEGIAIIDDSTDMAGLRRYLVQISPKHGFIEKYVDHVLKMLEKPI